MCPSQRVDSDGAVLIVSLTGVDHTQAAIVVDGEVEASLEDGIGTLVAIDPNPGGCSMWTYAILWFGRGGDFESTWHIVPRALQSQGKSGLGRDAPRKLLTVSLVITMPVQLVLFTTSVSVR